MKTTLQAGLGGDTSNRDPNEVASFPVGLDAEDPAVMRVRNVSVRVPTLNLASGAQSGAHQQILGASTDEDDDNNFANLVQVVHNAYREDTGNDGIHATDVSIFPDPGFWEAYDVLVAGEALKSRSILSGASIAGDNNGTFGSFQVYMDRVPVEFQTVMEIYQRLDEARDFSGRHNWTYIPSDISVEEGIRRGLVG